MKLNQSKQGKASNLLTDSLYLTIKYFDFSPKFEPENEISLIFGFFSIKLYFFSLFFITQKFDSFIEFEIIAMLFFA